MEGSSALVNLVEPADPGASGSGLGSEAVLATEQEGETAPDELEEAADPRALCDTLLSMCTKEIQARGQQEDLEEELGLPLQSTRLMSFSELLFGNWDGFDMTSGVLANLDPETEVVQREAPTLMGTVHDDDECWSPSQMVRSLQQAQGRGV